MTSTDKKTISKFNKRVNKFAEKFDLFPDDGLVLVAVSGGADSMCLLDSLLEISSTLEKLEKPGFKVAAAHFNHKLRGDESNSDEAFVTEECKNRGVRLYKGRASARYYASRKKLGIVEAARELRYDFFIKTAEKISSSKKNQEVRIATAHNADDLAETLIMNLVRGSGILGLSGIPVKRDSIIRPFLHTSRDEIMKYIDVKEIKFVEDSTNSLQNQVRNKIRHSVIPILREINPRFTEAAVRATELFRLDEEYLSDVAKEYIDSKDITAPCLSTIPYPIASRIVRQMSKSNKTNISHRHVESVLEVCKRRKSLGAVSLPGMIAEIGTQGDGSLVFKPNTGESSLYVPTEFSPITLKDGDTISIPEANLSVSCSLVMYDSPDYDSPDKTFSTFLFHVEQVCGIMSVGSRRDGDSIRLLGSNYTKKLKKLFHERRVPIAKRGLIPVISDEKGVLAIYGLGRSNRALPALGEYVLKVEFMPEEGRSFSEK